MPCRPKVRLPIAPQKMGRRTRTKPRQQSQASRPPDRIVMSTPIGGVRATRKVNLRMAISLTEDEIRLLKQLETAAEHGRTRRTLNSEPRSLA